MDLKIYDDSKNYTCQVIKLPAKIAVKGLDNLVEVNVQGNSCLVGKDSDPDELYLFFPAECQISHDFLSANNLYRHSELNVDKTKTGFFDDNRRVKAIKFKGIISSGFVIPLESLSNVIKSTISASWKFGLDLSVGIEFNSICGIEICKKYIRPAEKKIGMSNPRTKVLDEIIDSRMAPEHPDTSHLMKNIHKLQLDDYIAVTYKLHGTSARFYNTLIKKKLTWKDKVAKFFGINVVEEEYQYVAASRRVVKSVGFEELPNKNHYFTSGDLWSEVGREFFDGKLNKGEAIYCEIVGKTYSGEAIQHGYTYGFDKPKVFIYRISNINAQGIEVDLGYLQMKDRAKQLNVECCPEFYYGTLGEFIWKYHSGFGNGKDDQENLEQFLNEIFYTSGRGIDQLLEQPSILDKSVVEEGYCIRKDTCNKPEIFKIKSKQFLLHEGKQLDKVDSVDIEETQSV